MGLTEACDPVFTASCQPRLRRQLPVLVGGSPPGFTCKVAWMGTSPQRRVALGLVFSWPTGGDEPRL